MTFAVTRTVSFEIGSVDSFERKLEFAQRELGIHAQDFVPVKVSPPPLVCVAPFDAFSRFVAQKNSITIWRLLPL